MHVVLLSGKEFDMTFPALEDICVLQFHLKESVLKYNHRCKQRFMFKGVNCHAVIKYYESDLGNWK
jgi:hypothetical protein